MLETIFSPAEWQRLPRTPGFSGKTVGLVPTMGALHKGHISLVNRCIKENDISVVSIFINPTQFNNSDDFSNYPKTIQKDRALLEEAGVQYLFLPTYNNLYKDGYVFKIIETDFSKKLCGIHRPGHFDGVLTVVMKLLNIIKPDRAYFGEKDFQQFILIKKMAEAFFIKTEIISCETVREDSGLACSSRNNLLKPGDKKIAPEFHHTLKQKIPTEETERKLEKFGFKVDYIKDLNERRFGAVSLSKIRLIDNVKQ